MIICSLGIDPGPVPGFFLAAWDPGEREAAWAHAFQCNADAALSLLANLMAWHAGQVTCGQIEEFRTRPGPGSRGRHASVTREMITVLGELAADRGVKLAVRHSSAVFPWATDKRLRAAGLHEATAGLPHARAASGHALFCAVHDGGLPDPLSGRSG